MQMNIEVEVDRLEPVNAVLNYLAGEFTAVGLSVLRRGSQIVICGRMAGQYSEIDTQALFFEHKRIIGSTMGTEDDLERVVGFFEDGTIDPPLYETYALDAADQAFADRGNRDIVGKLVITP